MNDLIIQNIQKLILPKSTDKPLKGRVGRIRSCR